MSIEVTQFEESDAEEWNSLVDRAESKTPFHRFDVLTALADESGSDCCPLVGYKGQEPVGLFPLFGVSKGPISATFSPPPNVKTPYMGPLLLNMDKLKRRKRDRRHRQFIESCLEWADGEFSPQYTNVRTAVRHADVRPFVWNGFDAVPRYTYEVDLTVGESELLESFSRDLRAKVTEEYDRQYEISEGGAEAIEHIVRQTRARHEEQGESFPVSASMPIDMYENAEDGVVRPYRCDLDGEFVGGLIALDNGETLYSWIGGAKVDVDLPTNDLLNWQVCKDGIERGLTTYDLGGANNPRLCSYKAKFAPELSTYFRVHRATRTGDALVELYDKLATRL